MTEIVMKLEQLVQQINILMYLHKENPFSDSIIKKLDEEINHIQQIIKEYQKN